MIIDFFKNRSIIYFLIDFFRLAIRYIDIVAGLAIDQDGRVVAVDSVSPTVFCIDENGELVHWFDCSNQMKEPSDIAVYQHEYFICDFKGHCVCVFSEQGKFLFLFLINNVLLSEIFFLFFLKGFFLNKANYC